MCDYSGVVLFQEVLQFPAFSQGKQQELRLDLHADSLGICCQEPLVSCMASPCHQYNIHTEQIQTGHKRQFNANFLFSYVYT